MPCLLKQSEKERPRPLFASIALLLCGTIALSGCVSTTGKDAVAELLTPDEQSVADANQKQAPYQQTLANAASPSPEYDAQSGTSENSSDTLAASSDTGNAGQTGVAGAVMEGTAINANRSSIFASAAPATLEDGTSEQPAATGGINATNSSVFSSTRRNPLLSASEEDEGGTALAYLGDDDIPLIMRGKLYSSSDLGPDPNDTASDLVKLASLPSMTRQSVTGLLVQNQRVDTSCFKPALVGMLRDAESHFGQKIVVTSGFRDAEHNHAVGGAKRSQHLTCDAADIQMVGVSKWDLASYFRSRADIGGVGTYCTTNSIHVDIGPRRDWNWKCRRDTEL